MSYTIPIILHEITNVTLPYNVYEDGSFKISITEFTIADKEYLFGITNLKISDTDVKYNIDEKSNSTAVDNFSEYLKIPYRIQITPKELTDASFSAFQKMSYDLNFCCILFFNYPIRTTILKYEGSNRSINSGQSFRLKAEKVVIDENVLKSFSSSFITCLKNSSIDAKKKSLLNSLIKITVLQTFNLGLACSTYISILESLFTNENTEIAYRFSMRLTKYLNKDSDFVKNIKKLYGKRSSYYHSGEIKFDAADESFLSNLSRQMIIEYLKNPDNFDIVKLDEELLK